MPIFQQLTLFYYYFNYLFNIYTNYLIDASLWKKIRKIIISIKYSQENIQLLKRQIEALEIKEARISQLG